MAHFGFSFPGRILQAGALQMNYDAGGLRYIRAGEEEILRGIYVSLRDETWTTLQPSISNEEVLADRDGFIIRYDCHYILNGSPVLRLMVKIEGYNSSKIRFSIAGPALDNFKKNRCGLCILHPVASCTGQRCEITTTEGHVVHLDFPQFISPRQPFKNIKKMRWKTLNGTLCKIRCYGDIFETEDQRNWTDASYKTYSTPLELPFPVLLKKGDIISQKILFAIESSDRNNYVHPIVAPAMITFDLNSPFSLPQIGSSFQLTEKSAGHYQYQLLKNLHLDHLRVDVKLYDNAWQKDLKKYFTGARLLSIPLKVVLHISKEKELTGFIAAVSADHKVITEILLLGPGKITNENIFNKYAPILKKVIPHVKVGGGTDCYFAEINRNIINANNLDFIAFSVTPQVHAFDTATLVENIGAQYDVVNSARHLYPQLPIHVSPITLRPRFNPDATDEYISGSIPLSDEPDPRQHTTFAAGWTLGSINNLIAAGVDSITYYESIGSKGIIPEPDDQLVNCISPLYILIRLIMDFKRGEFFPGYCNIPMTSTGIFMISGHAKRWIIANHSSQSLKVEISNLNAKASVRKLDKKSLSLYLLNPNSFFIEKGTSIQTAVIELSPESIVIVDSGSHLV